MDSPSRRDVLKLTAASVAAVAGGTAAAEGERGKAGCQGQAKPEGKGPDKYLILACDGGGIRGLLSALLIQQLETEFHILERVSLFAGTSTGGILSLGLGKGLKIQKLIELYENEGESIFQPYEAADSHICQQILGETRYHRIQVELKEAVPLDDFKQIAKLNELARGYIASPAWAGVKEWVKKFLA